MNRKRIAKHNLFLIRACVFRERQRLLVCTESLHVLRDTHMLEWHIEKVVFGNRHLCVDPLRSADVTRLFLVMFVAVFFAGLE